MTDLFGSKIKILKKQWHTIGKDWWINVRYWMLTWYVRVAPYQYAFSCFWLKIQPKFDITHTNKLLLYKNKTLDGTEDCTVTLKCYLSICNVWLKKSWEYATTWLAQESLIYDTRNVHASFDILREVKESQTAAAAWIPRKLIYKF